LYKARTKENTGALRREKGSRKSTPREKKFSGSRILGSEATLKEQGTQIDASDEILEHQNQKKKKVRGETQSKIVLVSDGTEPPFSTKKFRGGVSGGSKKKNQKSSYLFFRKQKGKGLHGASGHGNSALYGFLRAS